MSDAALGVLLMCMGVSFWFYFLSRARAAYARKKVSEPVEALLLESGLYPVLFVFSTTFAAWSIPAGIDLMGVPVDPLVHDVLLSMNAGAGLLLLLVLTCGRPRFLVPTSDPDGFPLQLVTRWLRSRWRA
ncbi:hypothetical protein [Aquipuribacter sp. MA13-6]|uniref:hypothetical protein n=1 Tax=unclassified Aquipuribacter TaxID=2635084 RepID=UPI003EEA8357